MPHFEIHILQPQEYQASYTLAESTAHQSLKLKESLKPHSKHDQAIKLAEAEFAIFKQRLLEEYAGVVFTLELIEVEDELGRLCAGLQPHLISRIGQTAGGENNPLPLLS